MRMRGLFARGLAFERAMVALLRADAALPQAQRLWLRDFIDPRIETYVGVTKKGQPGVRFVDALVIERQPPAGQPPRVESFSFKSRDLRLLDEDVVAAQMKADATDALRYYGETLNIRRRVLKYLGPEVQTVQEAAVEKARKAVPGVEVLVQ
jgi:hypothetical protein